MDHVLLAVGYRQWVLSFPGPMAVRMGHDAPLLAAIAGRLARAVMQDMRRGAKQQHGLASDASLHAGAVTVAQRFRSDLGLYVLGWRGRIRRVISRSPMPDVKIPELLEKLISVSEGNLLAIASLADDVAGGHIKKALESTQSKFDAALAEDTRDALLETMKLVQYNATTFRIVQEIIGLLHDDVSALQSLTAKWAAQPGQTPPDLRDVVVGAATIASTYASSTGPLRRMYIEALRGSFAPEIFTFAFGPELLDALIVSGTLPGDIDTLITLSTTNNEFVDLNELRHGKLDANRSDLLEVCERLAKGGFVDLLPQQHDGDGPVVVRHRTEAFHSKLRIVVTRRGHRLLTMMKAGRGK